MGIGIDPDERNPCQMILRDDGKSYVRFFVGASSNCGKFETMKMLHLWSNQDEASPSHPFGWIMKFISSRPPGCANSSDWLDFAHDFLAASDDLPAKMPRRLDDIPAITKTAPEAKASYILAFVHCRAFCLDLVRNARRQVMMSSQDNVGHSLIDTNLPRNLQRDLIARLQG